MLSCDAPDTEMPEALVVDDADLAAGAFPERLARFAARGTLVIATLPKHLAIGPDGIDPTWARVADHILDIQRPDLLDTNSLRPGEADLHLVKKSCTNMSSTPSAAPPRLAGRLATRYRSSTHRRSIFGPRPLRKPFKADRRLRCRDPLASSQARSRGRPRGPGGHP